MNEKIEVILTYKELLELHNLILSYNLAFPRDNKKYKKVDNKFISALQEMESIQ